MRLSRLVRWSYLLLAVTLVCLPSGLFAQEQTPAAGSDITIHVVQRGETLFRIATSYGLSVDALARLNGITNPDSIFVGQRLLVTPGNAGEQGRAQSQTHTVHPGETLRSIARFYGVTVQDLIVLNQIADANTIYVGQSLRIMPVESASPTPGTTAVAEEPVTPAATAVADRAPGADATPVTGVVHVVQRGETLFRIATSYGLTVNELARANTITDPTLIYVGQELLVPNTTGTSDAAALDLPEPMTQLDVIPQVLVEGQTMRLRLTTDRPVSVTGTFLGRMLSAGEESGGTRHVILQGVPMYTEAGIYPLDLTLTDEAGNQTPYSMNLQVAQGRYGSEYIRLLADRNGLLDPSVEEAEQRIITNITGQFNPVRAFSGPMSLPAAATIISPFGTRRSYNGGAFDRFHSGTDFAGAPGTPVLATAPGRVVLADGLNVRGNATIIDHGWGIYTGYWHQSEIYVRPGDTVSAGQVIGTIGATGRVTGAHLHWEIWVGGVAVDPMQWVRIAFV